MQQYTQLRQEGISTFPRQQFIQDIIQQINTIVNHNTKLILMGDFNEILGEDTDGMIKIIQQTALIDIFPFVKRTPCQISTCAKADSTNRRIDYILGTPNILPFITKCGYLRFYDGILSDHRGLFIELNNSMIGQITSPQKPPARKIGSKSHHQDRKNYKKYIDSKFREHRIYEKSKKLHDISTTSIIDTESFQKDLNKLDQDITKWMLKAEQTCCKKRPNNSWTPAIGEVSKIIKYWQVVIKGKRNRIDVSDLLSKIYNSMSDETKYNIDSTYEQPVIALKTAINKKQKLYSSKSSGTEEGNTTNKYHTHSNSSCAIKFPKITTSTEDSKKLFQRLKSVMKSERQSGLTHIEVPDGINTSGDEQWKKITNPNEIEEYLLSRNEQHFGQAEKSPFCNEKMRQKIGYEGTNQISREVVNNKNTSSFQNESVYTKEIFDKLSDGHNIQPDEQTVKVSFDEFKKALRRWNEQTSTSPSLRHLGHYKALLTEEQATEHKSTFKSTNRMHTPPINQTKDDAIDYQEISDGILQVLYYIATAAFNSGVTIQRWCNSTTMMIEKIPGCPKINKLRVIHLFEADYNLMLKIIWTRKAIWEAHRRHKLDTSQAGSRPGKRCIDVVIQKELKFLHARLTRTPMITIDNDAKACYDRIPCNLAMISSYYFGVPSNACKTHAATLKDMKYKVRTALGDSKKSYKHTSNTPIHGTGQGSCASPSIWLMISVILIECLKQKHEGMKMSDPTRALELAQIIEGFVDDTSLYINSHTNDISDIKQKALSVFQHWNDLLTSAGGKLEIPKCFYYTLAWEFEKDGTPKAMDLDTIQSKNNPIYITNSDNDNLQIIDQKDVKSSHRTLGAYKTMTGDEKDQLQYLQTKSNNLATLAVSGKLTRRQAHTMYHTMYMPAMTYCLPASTHNNIELTKVQTKAVQLILQ